jgi:peroxiredoxin
MVLINDNSSALTLGDSLPSFALPATDGETYDTTMIKDPVLAVIFTCNHCPYAQAYEQRLKEMGDAFSDTGVQFVLINSNDAANYPEDSFENMKKKHKEAGYAFPYCFDEDQSVAKAYGALCTPHCFVFDADRKLKYKGRIDGNWEHPDEVTEHNLHDAITALLKGEEPLIHEANAIGCSIKWKEKVPA